MATGQPQEARDAFKEINFRFDDDLSVNTEVVIHRKQRRPLPTTTREEEDFRRNCRQTNTSTPKKPSQQSEVKLAMNSARSSFFGLDDDSANISNYDDPQPPRQRRDSQMDTADLLENCTGDGDDSQENYRTCDINNNNNENNNQEKRNSNKESESGLGSISAASDEPDAKLSPEKMLLLENAESGGGKPQPMPRNIIREPIYYPKNPTQTVYLATTVPQNIKGNKIMGRHTPTRSSLRHSRMLVISKDLRGALNPLNIFHPKWATFFLILNILLGLFITAIGLWILLWAPNTRIQDNPYWSGLILILCGSMGVVVMEFKRIPRNQARERCFNWLRMNLLFILFLTLIVTFAAFLFAALHSISLFAINTVCIPASLFSKSPSCVCVFDKPIVDVSELEVDQRFQRNDTERMDTEKMFLNIASGSQFHYRDLNCNEVQNAFKLILLGSSLSNLIAFISTLGFLLLYYHGTRQVNLYATVQQQPTTTGPAITTAIV